MLVSNPPAVLAFSQGGEGEKKKNESQRLEAHLAHFRATEDTKLLLSTFGPNNCIPILADWYWSSPS